MPPDTVVADSLAADVAGVILLTIALAVAQRAAREARRSGLRLIVR
jgi:hypothetical protein